MAVYASPRRFLFSSLDLTDARAVGRCVRAFRPHVIIHAAAWTDVDACERDIPMCEAQNFDAVISLARVAEALDAFLVYISTDFVFAGDRGPYREYDTTGPLNCYGRTKWLAECTLSAANLRVAILRTSLLYGDAPYFTRPNLFVFVREALRMGKTLCMVDDQYRTPTYAKDLARVCHYLAAKEVTGIFHVAGSETLTPYTMAQMAAAHLRGVRGKVLPIASSQRTTTARRPPHSGLVIDRAMETLGYVPTPYRSALCDMEPEGF